MKPCGSRFLVVLKITSISKRESKYYRSYHHKNIVKAIKVGFLSMVNLSMPYANDRPCGGKTVIINLQPVKDLKNTMRLAMKIILSSFEMNNRLGDVSLTRRRLF